MRKLLIGILAVATAAALSSTAPASADMRGNPDPSHLTPHVVASFGSYVGGAFLESIAPDGRGNLIASVNEWGYPLDPSDVNSAWTDNIGQLVRVSLDGTQTPFGPALDLGPCTMITGVTVDGHGRIYVAVFDFAFTYPPDSPACGARNMPTSVLRVAQDGYTVAMSLPDGTMPNGITTHDDTLYVADSAGGAVWRGSTTHRTSPRAAWYSSAMLAPASGAVIGADGIAYRDDALYVTSYSQGLLVRIGIGERGDPRHARVVAADPLLVNADGITFDGRDRAWITVNNTSYYGADDQPVQNDDARLLVVSPSGRVTVAATPPGSLDYPTQAVIDRHGTVYVANGAYNSAFISGASPTIMAFTG